MCRRKPAGTGGPPWIGRRATARIARGGNRTRCAVLRRKTLHVLQSAGWILASLATREKRPRPLRCIVIARGHSSNRAAEGLPYYPAAMDSLVASAARLLAAG